MCETHQGSYVNLLGKPFDEISEQEKREYSNELHVTDITPPAFIWYTATDQTVPVYGSLRLAESYVRAGVLVELRIFPNGPHGMALATEHTSCGVADYIDERVSEWLEDSLKWMKSIS
jgi:acetyl esterase/lipase